jgi:ABC-type amino acid transport substrate-binding protein
MRISLKNFLIILLVTMFCSFHVQAEKKKLIVGTSAEYPPFSFIEKGEIVGFDIDLINIIADNLGYDLEIKDVEFKNLFNDLKNKETDIIISGITVTEERLKKFYFSGRYYFPSYAVIHRKDDNIYSENELYGKTVAVFSGSSMETFLFNHLSRGKKMKIMKYTSNNFMVKELKEKKIDAILVENAQAKLVSEQNKNISYFLIKKTRPGGYAIVFRKNSPLVDIFNDEIVSLKTSSQLEVLKKKWGL